jgi:hypothetical protein
MQHTVVSYHIPIETKNIRQFDLLASKQKSSLVRLIFLMYAPQLSMNTSDVGPSSSDFGKDT